MCSGVRDLQSTVRGPGLKVSWIRNHGGGGNNVLKYSDFYVTFPIKLWG